MVKPDELEIDETGICYSLEGKRYHRLAWYARDWSWRADGGYWRSVCGILDSVVWDMRMAHADDKYYAQKISDKTPCKRCFPNGDC